MDDSRAIAYLRRSRVNEARPGAVSHEQQTNAVRSMAEAKGFADVPIIEDWGKSGGSTRGRESYRQLLAAIEDGAVTDVFSYDLSRLTRSISDWVRLAALCKAHQVRVHLAQEGLYDFSKVSMNMNANILASVAEAVRGWASERSTLQALDRKAKHLPIGRKPYGDRPGESLEAVKAAYIEAGSFYGAAKLLDAKGLPHLLGKSWVASSVSFIIRKQCPDLAPIFPATGGPQGPAKYELQKLVKCHCGRTLSPYRYRSGAKFYVTYRCTGRAKVGHPQPYAIPEAVLLDWAKAEAAHLRVPAHTIALREEADTERLDLEAQRSNLIDMRQRGQIDGDELDRRLATVYEGLERVAAISTMATVATIVQPINWAKDPAAINDVLRALWVEIPLQPDMSLPGQATWRLPEWRG